MVILYGLCDRIVEFRNNLGITQAELGRKLGVTRSAVNTWEMGLSIPQLKHVVEMADIFHTTVDEPVNTSERVTVDITDLDPKGAANYIQYGRLPEIETPQRLVLIVGCLVCG